MKTFRVALLLLAAFSSGCAAETEATAPAEHETLASAPVSGSVTPNTIFGIWEAPAQKAGDVTLTVRYEFRADKLVAAANCTSPAVSKVVGFTAKANITETRIEVFEAKSALTQVGNVGCGVQFSAGQLPACDASVEEAKRTSCYVVKDSSLMLYAPALTKLTKVGN
jgi:hypothetical protein